MSARELFTFRNRFVSAGVGIAAGLFVLTALGGFRPVLIHTTLAVVVVGGMWSFFTFGLDVILPKGEWTGF